MIRLRPLLRLTLLFSGIVSTSSACADTNRASRVAVTDSSGVRIIESSVPLWQDSNPWKVESEPAVQIGVAEGALPYEFDRVAGAVRLPDGSIVVADGGTNELRFYSEDGVHLRSVGRSGSGPGEYEHIRALMSCDKDSIYAFDLNWQVKVYSLSGELAREATLLEPGVNRTPYRLTCSSTGKFVITGWGVQSFQRQIGFYEATSPVYVLDRDGNLVLELGEFISSERIGSETGSRPHPFGRAASFAITEGEVFVGTGEHMQILVYGIDGVLRRVLRGPDPDLSIRREDLDTYRERMLLNVPDARRPEFESEMRSMPLPDRFPALTDVRIDPEGHVWARLFQRPGMEQPRWGVFATNGNYFGELDMPTDFEVTEIGHDYVLGVHRDELGVERVRLHRIDRTAQ